MDSKNRTLVILNTLTLAIMLVANYLSGTGAFSGVTVADISRKYDTLFAPAGYAFAVWGVIFLLAIGFVIYQWVLLKQHDPHQYIRRTGIWFAVSNMANTLWLYCWNSEQIGLSVALILLLLVCLCILAMRLRLELDDEPVLTIFFVWWPLVIYLGWIMVASIACIASWFVSLGWHGGPLTEDVWTIVMIAIATALYLILLKTNNLREAAGVGIWSFVAIAIRQWDAYKNISWTAIIAALILLIATGIHASRNQYFTPFAKIKRKEWS